jgi:hypothetical protein
MTRTSTKLNILPKNLLISPGSTLGRKHLALQRHNTENSKQIFPEKVLHGLSTNFHTHVSVSGLYIPTIGLPILLQENM